VSSVRAPAWWAVPRLAGTYVSSVAMPKVTCAAFECHIFAHLMHCGCMSITKSSSSSSSLLLHVLPVQKRTRCIAATAQKWISNLPYHYI
jgi:hypothetical protein